MKKSSIIAGLAYATSILFVLWLTWSYVTAKFFSPAISEVGFQRAFDPEHGVVYEDDGMVLNLPRDFGEPYGMFAVTNSLVPRAPEDGRAWLSLSRVEDRAEGCVATNILVLYDETSGSIQERYRETSERGSPLVPQRCRVLRVMGMVNNDPVVVADDPDSSGGPCANPWADTADHFFVFSNRVSELSSFRIPLDKLQREQARQATCLSQL